MNANLNILNSTFSIAQNRDLPFDTHHYSITINDFENKEEAEIILKKVKALLREWKSPRKVYGQ